MEKNPYGEVSDTIENGVVKDIANVLKKVNSSDEGTTLNGENLENNYSSNSSYTTDTTNTTFKVATNLPEKTSVWTKIKNVLFYEIKVELTPSQQKVEDEINEYLHQEITWSSFKNFLFKEVPITYKGKRIF